MAFNSNSQISYLILDSLSGGSKYGLEIIEYISDKTNGNFSLKKPTLYSCLTRLEKKGYISSSYWEDSEFGGKRHYYTITNDGRRSLEELATEYANLSYENGDFDSKSDTNENKEKIATAQTSENAPENINQNNDSPVFLQQDNLFDLVKQPQPQIKEESETSDVNENQIDFFTYEKTLPAQTQPVRDEHQVNSTFENTKEVVSAQNFEENTSNQTNENTQLDDARFLDESERLTPMQERQNQILFDTSSELKKYRKRKSFSENQIEMAVVYENAEDREIQRSRIEQLKKSLLSARENATTTQSPLNNEPAAEQTIVKNNFQAPIDDGLIYKKETIESKPDEEERKDDAVFITTRFDSANIPISRKIAPLNIDVDVSDSNLPAPKRNANLEPTYKDMMAKLFERKKEKKVEPITPILEPKPQSSTIEPESFTDYETLKKYYAGHGIEFKEYHKHNVKRQHNTNFLNLISSIALLLLSGIGCSILFAIIASTHHLSMTTNFMFYTLPILFFIYVAVEFIKFKLYPSKKATMFYTALINWAIFILATVIVFVVNIICGMQYESMTNFLTPLLVPILGILLIFPLNYYIKKFLYKKFGK